MVVDYIYVDVNRATERALGRKKEDLMGQSALQVYGEDALSLHMPRIREAREGGRSVTYEGLFMPLDNYFLNIIAPLSDEMFLISSMNITEIKQAQNAVERERARLQFILDSLPVAVSVADAKGRLQIVNMKTYEIWRTERPLAEDIDQYATYNGFRPGTEIQLKAKEWPISRALMDGETISNEEIDIQRLDGSRGTILASAIPMKDGQGKIMGGLATYVDITTQKEIERNLESSNAELQQFAYVASHDLQEPLRMVTAYLGLLNKKFGSELSPQAKKYMSTAVRGSERMRQLIDDLLQFSRIDTKHGEFAIVDMNKVAHTVENNLQMAIGEARAHIVIEPLPTVLADETQMVQVLQNLISNAIKFHGAEAPRVEVSARHRGHEWIIAVKDNGIGIDPKYHENLFKMFQRLHTNEQYPGTGIGLAISKKIVERHGGRIWVESKKGVGSIFFFTIPETGGRGIK